MSTRNATQEAVEFLKIMRKAHHPKQMVQLLALPISDGTLGRKLREKAQAVEEAERNCGHDVSGIHRTTIEVKENGKLKSFTAFLWADGIGLDTKEESNGAI
jgi:hypothetical protein